MYVCQIHKLLAAKETVARQTFSWLLCVPSKYFLLSFFLLTGAIPPVGTRKDKSLKINQLKKKVELHICSYNTCLMFSWNEPEYSVYFRLEFVDIFLPKLGPLIYAPELKTVFTFKNNWFGQLSGFPVENEDNPL